MKDSTQYSRLVRYFAVPMYRQEQGKCMSKVAGHARVGLVSRRAQLPSQASRVATASPRSHNHYRHLTVSQQLYPAALFRRL
jgi:hypothetical protein